MLNFNMKFEISRRLGDRWDIDTMALGVEIKDSGIVYLLCILDEDDLCNLVERLPG